MCPSFYSANECSSVGTYSYERHECICDYIKDNAITENILYSVWAEVLIIATIIISVYVRKRRKKTISSSKCQYNSNDNNKWVPVPLQFDEIPKQKIPMNNEGYVQLGIMFILIFRKDNYLLLKIINYVNKNIQQADVNQNTDNNNNLGGNNNIGNQDLNSLNNFVVNYEKQKLFGLNYKKIIFI